MALVKGTNCGFVEVAPVNDPAEGRAQSQSRARALKDVAPAGAIKVTEIGWWCDDISEEANFEVAIYDHNVGDNNPEAIVGSDKTNAKGTTAGWKRVTGLNIEITPEDPYWIAVQFDTTATPTYLCYVASGGEKADESGNITTLDDPWGVSAFTQEYLLAMYAVWEAAGPDETAKHGSINQEMGADDSPPGLYK